MNKALAFAGSGGGGVGLSFEICSTQLLHRTCMGNRQIFILGKLAYILLEG